MAKKRVMYMHTLDGKPASYDPGYQVHFASPGRWSRRGIQLCASIADIHREWRESEAWRERQELTPAYYPHGYVRVEIP